MLSLQNRLKVLALLGWPAMRLIAEGEALWATDPEGACEILASLDVTALNLSNHGLTSDMLSPLQNTCFARLQKLDLRGNCLSYLPTWLGGPAFSELKVLQVSRNPLLATGCRELAKCVCADTTFWGYGDKGVESQHKTLFEPHAAVRLSHIMAHHLSVSGIA